MNERPKSNVGDKDACDDREIIDDAIRQRDKYERSLEALDQENPEIHPA